MHFVFRPAEGVSTKPAWAQSVQCGAVSTGGLAAHSVCELHVVRASRLCVRVELRHAPMPGQALVFVYVLGSAQHYCLRMVAHVSVVSFALLFNRSA